MKSKFEFEINEKSINGSDLTYDDIIYLYEKFKNDHGKIPTTKFLCSKYGLPTPKVLKYALKKYNKTINDIYVELHKYSNVRSIKEEYDNYVNEYKRISNEIGRYIKSGELTNNQWGLPSASWFVKNCPDKNIKNYNDFIKYCGYVPFKKDKEYVSKKLISLQEELEREITQEDIKNLDFSMIVVNRLWGSLSLAKEDLGMINNNKKRFDFISIKTEFDNICNKIISENRFLLTKKDFSNPRYTDKKHGFKTYENVFIENGLDILDYIKSLDLKMKDLNYYRFEDGEGIRSSLEHFFSNYLRKNGFRYKYDYVRDVPYKKFSSTERKLDCDYVITCNGGNVYIEVVGMITDKSGWREDFYVNDNTREYQKNLLEKENLLTEAGLKYAFVFGEDLEYARLDKILGELFNG